MEKKQNPPRAGLPGSWTRYQAEEERDNWTEDPAGISPVKGSKIRITVRGRNTEQKSREPSRTSGTKKSSLNRGRRGQNSEEGTAFLKKDLKSPSEMNGKRHHRLRRSPARGKNGDPGRGGKGERGSRETAPVTAFRKQQGKGRPDAGRR